ncbi:MAG TPA: hypothetical protein VLE95_04600 [Chlamydiales bacterium]|nr:hypothetical protein [Chlamydiales bacterium]
MSSTSVFTNAVIEVLQANTGSLSALNAISNLWSTSTQNIGNNWLEFQDNMGTEATKGKPKPAAGSLDEAIWEVENNINNMKLSDIFSNLTQYSVNDWCMDAVTTLQSLVAAQWGTYSDKAPIWNGILAQEATAVQSTSGQYTSTGDAEIKSCVSALQNASSAGQPVSDAGKAVIGVLSNGASAQGPIAA